MLAIYFSDVFNGINIYIFYVGGPTSSPRARWSLSTPQVCRLILAFFYRRLFLTNSSYPSSSPRPQLEKPLPTRNPSVDDGLPAHARAIAEGLH